MSSEEAAAAEEMCCASCGIAAVDDVKLKECDGGCDLVKYCSDDCQNNNRPQHDEECKKRLAEIRDRDLFTQPQKTHMGDCPICCLPLSIDAKKSIFMGCCSKMICNGCDYANKRRQYEAGLKQRCAFCRELAPKSKKEFDKSVMKRVKKNDRDAMSQMGIRRYSGGDYKTAFEYFTKAAELGDAVAHYGLSVMYYNGEGVEKDKEKDVYHLEQAAIAGHHRARHNLGCDEWNNGRYERAAKHFIIAASLGNQGSLNNLKGLYRNGLASKEDYANALRAYQAAVNATKSSGREIAEEAMKNGELKLSF